MFYTLTKKQLEAIAKTFITQEFPRSWKTTVQHILL